MKQESEYSYPDIKVLEVYIEQGFANSLEDPKEKPEEDW